MHSKFNENGIVEIVEAVKFIKPCKKAIHVHIGVFVLCILYDYLGSGLLIRSQGAPIKAHNFIVIGTYPKPCQLV
jgi:hypothetical protein